MGTFDRVKQAAGKAAGKLLRPLRHGQEDLAASKLGPMRPLPVSSNAFEPGGRLSRRYTRDGDNISPPLSWADVPESTVSIAVLCEDPDAPTPKPFVHWVVYGLSGSARSLAEGVPEDAAASGGPSQGNNSFGNRRYDGPAPPPGHGVHHYHFQVFALDKALVFTSPPDRDELVQAMRGHVLAAGAVIGTYER